MNIGNNRQYKSSTLIRFTIARCGLMFLLCFVLVGSTAYHPDVLRNGRSGDRLPARDYDLLIVNGRILDGTGNPWYSADIAIKDGKIAWIGKADGGIADEVIDAEGMYLSPGFIDVHSHSASGLESEKLSRAKPLLAQGITTVVINPDGGGSLSIAAQRERLLEYGLGVNVVQLIPHGTIRRNVMGMENRPPERRELEQMKALVEEGMKEGAFGLSSGLFYTPGAWSETEELIELAAVAGRYNGVYSSHIRDESDYSVGLIASVEEVIRISREANVPGIVTHIKALGTGVWGFSVPVIQRIEQARSEGVEVFADQYPYPASSTSLTAVLVPAWAREGGREAMFQRIGDPETRARIVSEMQENLKRRGGAARIQISNYPADVSLEGMRLDEIANRFGMEPVDAALALIREHNPQIISFNMLEEDVARFMKQPWTMTGSDGGLAEFGVGAVHPRNYGTFPRKIKRYVFEEKIIDLPFAIRSMTALPASVFRLFDRGVIRPGMAADIVIFDPDRIRDRATYDDAHHLSEGMIHVLVNGKFAVRNGEFLPGLNGTVLSNKSTGR